MNTYESLRANPEILNKFKSREQIPLICNQCFKIYTKAKYRIQTDLHIAKNFCSQICVGAFKHATQTNIIKCSNCNIEFVRKKFATKLIKNYFCTKSCATKFNNMRKQNGTRISKLETWLHAKLEETYKKLEFLFNDKTIIGSELDIYIPELKLAFELNGIFHYEPIYGQKKLDQTINNDKNKFQKCQELGISLCVIDTSNQKYFKEKTSLKYLHIIENIINEVYIGAP